MSCAPLRRAHPRRLWVAVLWVLMAGAAGPCAPDVAFAAAPESCLAVDRAEADAVDPELWATLARWLDASGIALVEGPAPVPCASLRPVALASSPTGARVEVAGTPGQPVVVREVPRGDSAPVFRETIAQVVLSLIAPSAAEAMPPAAPSPPSTPPAPVPPMPVPGPPPRPVRLSAALGVGSTWLLVREWQAAFGGGVAARFAGRRGQPSLELSTRGLTSTPVAGLGVRALLRGTQLRASLSLALLQGSRWGLSLGTSLGLDVTRLDLRDAGPALVPVDAGRSLGALAGLLAALRVPLPRALELRFSAGLEIDLWPTRWVATGVASEQMLAQTARYRPVGWLALAWDFATLRPTASSEATP